MFSQNKIIFLMGFGHCGIDWLHSLLDSHEQILLMPAFSFYRSWKLLQMDKVRNQEEMIVLWKEYFNSPKMQGKETKQFYSKKDGAGAYGNKIEWSEALKAPGAKQMKYLKE